MKPPRWACSLVGAAVQAACQAKAPRRTVAAVAAASISAVLRGDDVAAEPAAHAAGTPGAEHSAADAHAVRTARAAARRRRRDAKRRAAQHGPQQMAVDEGETTAAKDGLPAAGVGQPGPSVPATIPEAIVDFGSVPAVGAATSGVGPSCSTAAPTTTTSPSNSRPEGPSGSPGSTDEEVWEQLHHYCQELELVEEALKQQPEELALELLRRKKELTDVIVRTHELVKHERDKGP